MTALRGHAEGPTKIFAGLLAVVVGLLVLGVIMVLSASASLSVSTSDSVWSLFRGQLIWAAAGSLLMVLAIAVDYRHLRRFAVPLTVAAAALMAAVQWSGLGLTFNGATRWLAIGPFSLQPSEIAKLALVVFVADLLSRPARSIDDTRATIRPVLVVSGFFLLLLVLQPHLGAILVIGVMVAMMMFLAGAKLLHLAAISACGLLVTGFMVLGTPWRRARFLAFRDPWADPADTGFQQLQSLHAITVGGLDGVGLGDSRAKWGFLPYAHSDFIFAIIGEELGFIGATVVVFAYAAAAVLGFAAAMRAPDRFGMLLAVGITTWITVQALINLGGVLALMPVTGVTLPFLSFGGSSLLVTLAAMGVLLNIAMSGQRSQPARAAARRRPARAAARRQPTRATARGQQAGASARRQPPRATAGKR